MPHPKSGRCGRSLGEEALDDSSGAKVHADEPARPRVADHGVTHEVNRHPRVTFSLGWPRPPSDTAVVLSAYNHRRVIVGSWHEFQPGAVRQFGPPVRQFQCKIHARNDAPHIPRNAADPDVPA